MKNHVGNVLAMKLTWAIEIDRRLVEALRCQSLPRLSNRPVRFVLGHGMLALSMRTQEL